MNLTDLDVGYWDGKPMGIGWGSAAGTPTILSLNLFELVHKFVQLRTLQL